MIKLIGNLTVKSERRHEIQFKWHEKRWVNKRRVWLICVVQKYENCIPQFNCPCNYILINPHLNFDFHHQTNSRVQLCCNSAKNGRILKLCCCGSYEQSWTCVWIWFLYYKVNRNWIHPHFHWVHILVVFCAMFYALLFVDYVF